MCIGVPGKVVEVTEERGVFMATVDYGDLRRSACLAYAPEVRVGDFVVVHVGFAVSVVDPVEAARTHALLAQIGRPEVPEEQGRSTA
jgi:hydrogenase expression/formation protein HypC